MRKLALMKKLALVLLLAGCSVAPEYKQPEVDLPAQWKETAPRFAEDGRKG